jgi:hypothetical protein
MKVLAIVLLLAVAQLIPSCGDSDDDDGASTRRQVIGYVDEKRRNNQEFMPYLIVINSLEYGVPYQFWLDVDVGDLVRFDGQTWRIVRKARG